MNTKQLTAFAEGMMRETSTQTGEWVTVSRIALDEMSRESLDAIAALEAAERANYAQSDHINQQQDRIDSLEQKNAALGNALGTAERERDDLRRKLQATQDELSQLLYAAAQPAVLPPEMLPENTVEIETLRGVKLSQMQRAIAADAYNQCRADAMALGAQQQKVVELPMPFDVAINLTRTCGDIEYQYHESGEHFDRDEIFSALDAANVKWEVKK